MEKMLLIRKENFSGKVTSSIHECLVSNYHFVRFN